MGWDGLAVVVVGMVDDGEAFYVIGFIKSRAFSEPFIMSN